MFGKIVKFQIGQSNSEMPVFRKCSMQVFTSNLYLLIWIGKGKGRLPRRRLVLTSRGAHSGWICWRLRKAERSQNRYLRSPSIMTDAEIRNCLSLLFNFIIIILLHVSQQTLLKSPTFCFNTESFFRVGISWSLNMYRIDVK